MLHDVQTDLEQSTHHPCYYKYLLNKKLYDLQRLKGRPFRGQTWNIQSINYNQSINHPIHRLILFKVRWSAGPVPPEPAGEPAAAAQVPAASRPQAGHHLPRPPSHVLRPDTLYQGYYLSIYLSIICLGHLVMSCDQILNIKVSIYLSIYVSIYLSIYLVDQHAAGGVDQGAQHLHLPDLHTGHRGSVQAGRTQVRG